MLTSVSHLLYLLHPHLALRVLLELIPAVKGREEGPPWTGHQPTTGPAERQPFTLTPVLSLDSSVRPKSYLWIVGEKPHLHRENKPEPELRFKPPTFLL